MKKIIMTVAVVCSAVAVNAAAFSWSNNGGGPTTGKIFDKNSAVLADGTTAYLFCTADLTQQAFLTGILAATDKSAYLTGNQISGASATTSGGRIAQTSDFTYACTTGNTYDFYYAILKGDDVLISQTASAVAQASASEMISFSGSATWSKSNIGAATSFSSAGWYATPEPTSGLLLLVGLAGLALKRKRA